MNTDMVMAALKQTITDRNNPEKVIHHSDHEVQYLPIRNTDKMTDSSVPVNGLYNSEVLENLKKQWQEINDIEPASFRFLGRFNKT